MSTNFHKTLIVTGLGREAVVGIRNEATNILFKAKLDHLITSVHGGMNNVFSFAILPSGSGEYCDMEIDFVACLAEICDIIDKIRLDDGDHYPSYTALTHGGDMRGIKEVPATIRNGTIERSDIDIYPADRMIAMDCETGGLGDDVSLLTVWFGVYSSEFQLMDELSLKIKPKDGIYHVQAEGLEVNGINIIEHDKVAITKSEAGQKLYKFLKKNKGEDMLIPVGHNISGDVRWINQHLMNAEAWTQFCSYRKLDSSTIARFLMMCGVLTGVEKAGLWNLVERFNLKEEIDGNWHEERFDAIASIMSIKKMIELVKEATND